MGMIEQDPASEFDEICNTLIEESRDSVTTVTWLNHFSALTVLPMSSDVLAKFSYIGIDGLLLCRLMGAPMRSSADLLLPRLLALLESPKVLLVGGTGVDVARAGDRVRAWNSDAIVSVMDGYEGLLRAGVLIQRLEEIRPDIVIVGLGAGLQESFAIECSETMDRGIVATCGGFIDQLGYDNYYPRWAYPLKLNWFVRLVREPKRLWQRYTTVALAAVLLRPILQSTISSKPGYARFAFISRGSAASKPSESVG